MADCFVTQMDLSLKDKLKSDLLSQGFEFFEPPYTIFSAKRNGIVVCLYKSGKLTVQGKNKNEFISYYLEPEILKDFSYNYPEVHIDFTPRIGIDEAGKGDFFGPLSIAGLYASEKCIKTLMTLGVKDSKSMSDNAICKVAKEIQKQCDYSCVTIFPEKYNELYATFKNLNALLAWGHATAIDNLVKKTGCTYVKIDQFAGEHYVEKAVEKKHLEISLHQQHRGESDIVVAGASILARYAFLEGLKKLSEEYRFELPKGASAKVIELGRAFVRKFGNEALARVSKTHFKTTQSVLS
ncbi:MAG: ribonuclease HIII [Simkaniaceae bacterium]|nr:ribonuclease HIII [Simkaniaceae bacterium]MCF7852737.1 ribonuclease HIII [Simkaniaceae bacterium]